MNCIKRTVTTHPDGTQTVTEEFAQEVEVSNPMGINPMGTNPMGINTQAPLYKRKKEVCLSVAGKSDMGTVIKIYAFDDYISIDMSNTERAYLLSYLGDYTREEVDSRGMYPHRFEAIKRGQFTTNVTEETRDGILNMIVYILAPEFTFDIDAHLVYHNVEQDGTESELKSELIRNFIEFDK